MNTITKYFKLILLGSISGILLNLAINLSGLVQLFPGYTDVAEPALFSLTVPVSLLLYGIVMPLLEEAVFRMLIFGFLRRRLNFPLSALISSVFFGLYHMNAVQFVYAFLMGLILAYVYEKDRRLRVPFIVHSAANISVYLLSLTGLFS